MHPTAREIREGLKREGRVYLSRCPVFEPIRVFNARVRNGELQVNTTDLWLTVGPDDVISFV